MSHPLRRNGLPADDGEQAPRFIDDEEGAEELAQAAASPKPWRAWSSYALQATNATVGRAG